MQAEVIIGVIAILRAHLRRDMPAESERGRTGRQTIPIGSTRRDTSENERDVVFTALSECRDDGVAGLVQGAPLVSE
jgi:hypothetical protein